MAELAFLGLGRMGANMVARMLLGKEKKIRTIVWNRSPEKVDEAVSKGAIGAKSVTEAVAQLSEAPRVVWMMLPAGDVTESVFRELLGLLREGDILIDGANSNFHDSIRRHQKANEKGIRMLDVGVSGGVVAAVRGYAMMVGGSRSAFDHCRPIFESMAQEDGYALVGEEGGSGHYVKMIHNAIEYGMMQAISEGFDLLQRGRYEDLHLKDIARLWNHGTIVSSFLMEMAARALTKSENLSYLKPYVEDNGEGRWSSIEAMEHGVPFVCNTYALHARYISRDSDSFAFRMLAAIRNEFGGHAIKK